MAIEGYGDNDAATADDATNVTSTYKGNDIDSDGDGTVDDSDKYDGLAPSDGSSGNLLETDGTTVSWSSAKLTESDINQESGSVSGDPDYTSTITLNNTYKQGKNIIAHETDVKGGDDGDFTAGSDISRSTDGNGDVTGFDITVTGSAVGSGTPVHWEIYGVTV